MAPPARWLYLPWPHLLILAALTYHDHDDKLWHGRIGVLGLRKGHKGVAGVPVALQRGRLHLVRWGLGFW